MNHCCIYYAMDELNTHFSDLIASGADFKDFEEKLCGHAFSVDAFSYSAFELLT